MTIIGKWIQFASNAEVKKDCERRNLHQLAQSIPPPLVYGEIKSSDLHDFIPSTYINSINGSTYAVRKDVYFDTHYHLTTVDEIKRFLKWNLVDKENYEIDHFDCNNFAIATWGDSKIWGRGLCFGLCLIPGHAKNWFLDANKIIYEVEPQSDVVMVSKGGISHYFV